MKQFAIIASALLFMTACKEEVKDLQTVEGEFIYTGDAAVIKGETFIYGVTLDEKSKMLAATVKPLQRDNFDMVPVIVEGTLTKKPEGTDGWDEVLTIAKVLEVKAPRGEAAVKIKGKQTSVKVDSLK